MIRFNKKLYYKYFDLFRMSSFLSDTKEITRSRFAMKLIEKANSFGIDLSDQTKWNYLNLDESILSDIVEFKESQTIASIDRYYLNIEEWIRYIILPDFLDIDSLAFIFRTKNISSREELIDYLSYAESLKSLGVEKSELYKHFVISSDWSSYPTNYATKYNEHDILERKYRGVSIKGCFHNHTVFSDGVYAVNELFDIASSHGYEYLGISDHTRSMSGLSDESIIEQHGVIDSLNAIHASRLLKSAECEILADGSLDLSNDCLSNLDYTIIAIHNDTNQVRRKAEYRLIKAIENRYANILAHPSGRLYRRKVELCIDMYKIIDACVANKVAIEINGDPDRLDLDPKYLQYAISKGAMFTLDSDTHLKCSYKNINNAIHIASDFNVPIEQCLNTMSYTDIMSFFRK